MAVVLSLEQIISEQRKRMDEVKKEMDSHKLPIAHSTPLDIDFAHIKRFEEAVKNSKDVQKHTIDAAIRWRVGDKEFLTLHITTVAKARKNGNNVYYWDHYGFEDIPVFATKEDDNGKEVFEVEKMEPDFFVEFSAEQWKKLSENKSRKIKYYVKTDEGMAFGPFGEKDWLSVPFDALEERGRTGKVEFTNKVTKVVSP